MKRYFIILVILFILMGVFSMDILGRSMKDIQDRMTGQVRYRINVVKGVVESENINKTYNCYIAGETVVYPNIPTFSRNPKLQPGDPVTIEFINGCRETPAILAPEDIRERPDTTLVKTNIFIMYQDFLGDNYIKLYDTNGELITSWAMPAGYYEANCICVDKNNNIYINYGASIVKRDSSGNIIVTQTDVENCDAIALGPDGCLYSREYWGGLTRLVKRNLNDLLDITRITFWIGGAGYNKSWYGLAFDPDGYFYMCNSTDSIMEKWEFLNSGQILTHAITTPGAEDSGLCIAGNYIGMSGGFQGTFTMKKTLTENEIILDIGCSFHHENPTSKNNNFLFLGDLTTDGHLVLKKYNSLRVLVWSIDILAPGSNTVDNAAVAAYPF